MGPLVPPHTTIRPPDLSERIDWSHVAGPTLSMTTSAWTGHLASAESNAAESCKYFARFREHCPDSADGWQRDGMCLANAGKREEAAKAFDTCVAKAPTDDQKDLCKQLKAQFAQ